MIDGKLRNEGFQNSNDHKMSSVSQGIYQIMPAPALRACQQRGDMRAQIDHP
jgi:hypothetical protein